MAGMPYPPNLCASVGGFLCQKVLCVPRILWDTLSVCFVGAVLALASGKAERRLLHQRGSILPRISRWLGCVIGGVGMAGMPYPPNLCLSVGGFLCQTVLCVPRVLWEHSLCLLCWCICGRHISAGFRPPPNQIASAIRLDCVSHPIRLRPPSNQIPSATRCHK